MVSQNHCVHCDMQSLGAITSEGLGRNWPQVTNHSKQSLQCPSYTWYGFGHIYIHFHYLCPHLVSVHHISLLWCGIGWLQCGDFYRFDTSFWQCGCTLHLSHLWLVSELLWKLTISPNMTAGTIPKQIDPIRTSVSHMAAGRNFFIKLGLLVFILSSKMVNTSWQQHEY